MNDVTQKYVNILHLTWESPTLLWTFKLLMMAGETRNSLNWYTHWLDLYYVPCIDQNDVTCFHGNQIPNYKERSVQGHTKDTLA